MNGQVIDNYRCQTIPYRSPSAPFLYCIPTVALAAADQPHELLCRPAMAIRHLPTNRVASCGILHRGEQASKIAVETRQDDPQTLYSSMLAKNDIYIYIGVSVTCSPDTNEAKE
uniref:Uncharacterized protein n=2 Tax=Spongospora subterranea TaxID=70186 RepID=A0A0H5QHZ7_9EUKA|eukprot:CRZ01598.1 hypothetical protein [Spongospora subterranea]